MTATDADSGSNGAISYHLSGSEVERFAVDAVTGEVTVTKPLDYESTTDPYVLTVIAQDSGETMLPGISVALDCIRLVSCLHHDSTPFSLQERVR